MPLDLSNAEPVGVPAKLDLSQAEPIGATSAAKTARAPLSGPDTSQFTTDAMGNVTPNSDVPQRQTEFAKALSEFDINKNFFVRGAAIEGEYQKIGEELTKTPEYKAELARRGGGEYSMMSWMNDHIAEEFEKRHQATPDDRSFMDKVNSTIQVAKDRPGLFAGEMVKETLEQPQMLLAGLWEIGLANKVAQFGKAAQGIARTADVAAQAGAAGAAQSAMQQYQETGKVNPAQAAEEGAMVAIPMAALHAAVRLGLGSVEKPGKVPSPREQLATETKAVNDVQAKISEGLTTDQALDQVLRAAGVAEDDAAQITKGTVDAINEKGQQDNLRNGEGVRGEEGQEGVLRQPEQGNDQGNAPNPPEEGIAPELADKPKATDFANLVADQSGKIDQRLLNAMGFVGLSGAATFALTGDGQKAAQVAMAAGATIAALAVANKIGAGVRTLFDRYAADTRTIPMEPFREFSSSQQVMGQAVENWARTTDALLANEPNKAASQIKVRDYVQGYRDVALTPGEQAQADAVGKFLDKIGNLAKDEGVIKQLREDYLTGVYQKKPFSSWKDILSELATDEAYRGNYTGMSPHSRYGLQKVIPDYRTAEALHEQGLFPLIPLTNDPVKIASVYARSVQKSIANKRLIDTLKQTPSERTYANGRPVPVIVGDTPDAAVARIVQGNAIVARKLDLTPEQVQVMNKFQILNAPSDYVPISHPTLEGLRVHKDVAPMLKMVFDTSDPSRAMMAAYGASMAAKGLFFTASIFHPYALLDVMGAVALPRAKFLLSIPKYWRELPQARAALKNSANAPSIKYAADSQLTFTHGVSDVDPTFLDRTFNYLGDLGGSAINKASLGLIPSSIGGMPFKAMKYVHDTFSNFLWNVVHPTLKLAAFNAETANAIAKGADPKTAGLQIAKATNDLFGGQNWFELANTVPSSIGRTVAMGLLTPSARRLQQMMFLSPDWNVSAQRAWYEGFKSLLPGVDRKTSDSMYRGYLAWSALTYFAAGNFLANQWTGKNLWDQKDWTYIDRGDGTKMQLNKHFMEFWHLAHNPVGFAMNKLNILPKEALDQAFGKEWIGFDPVKSEVYGPPMGAGAASRLAHMGKSVVPISFSQMMNDPVNGAISWITGKPIYGTTYEARDQAVRTKAEAKGKDGDVAVERAQAKRAKQQAAHP